MELVCELDGAGHTISEHEQKRALLRGLPPEYDVTAETIMSESLGYREAVSKMVVREIRLASTQFGGGKAVLNYTKDTRKCYACGKTGHIAHDCWSRNSSDSKKGNGSRNKETRVCYKCGKPGHIIRDCMSKDKGRGDNSGNLSNTAMLTLPKDLSMVSSGKKPGRWILDSGCTSL